jgi:hypothetical protein
MAWFKVDDQLPKNRKARAVRKSHPDKRRDIAPFGLWTIAGALSDDGWIALEVLEDWDDDAEQLAERLVSAGLWYATERDGEPGYVFHDWHDQNPIRDDNDPSSTGTFGNHVRWHVQRQIVAPDCAHCPKEPSADDRPDIGPISPPDIAPVGAESLPSRPDPIPNPTRADRKDSCASADAEREFDAWYATYPRKRGKGQAVKAYRAARKKASAATLLAAIEQQATSLIARGPDYCPYPATWLNGERWNDQPDTQIPRPKTRVQEHLSLVEQLAAEEAATIHEIGQRR